MFDMLDIGGSSLTAHKLFLDTVSNNLANINTAKKPGEIGYKRQSVIFQNFEDTLNSKLGVKATKIVQENRQDRIVNDPNNPYADAEGNVSYPDIDLSEEMTDMITAQRGYQLNLNAINYIKKIYEQDLEIGK